MRNEPSINRLYSVNEIDNLIRKQSRFKYSLADVILLLLYADRHPIKGKIRQMKEVFLILNEVFDKQSVQHVDFTKNRFGPYSEEVEYTIDQLAFFSYLSVSGKKTSKAVLITPKGMEYIKGKYHELPSEMQEKLKRKRLEWDTHIPSGLLKLVYTHYEEYLEKSVLKKRHQKLDWNDDNQRPDKFDP